MEGFQKRLTPAQWKPQSLARISTSEYGSVCSCGWATKHPREKVREDSVDRHVAKRHNGKAIRL